MTDNEIIKALECCADEMGCIKGCPCFNPKSKGSSCTVSKKLELEKLTIDLVKRQQAEIEELKEENKILLKEVKYEVDNREKAKSEGVKEFTERIEAEIEKDNVHSIMGAPISLKKLFDYLNKTKKEMLGENIFIEGTELALDYGLPVPEEDLEKYNKIVDKNKTE